MNKSLQDILILLITERLNDVSFRAMLSDKGRFSKDEFSLINKYGSSIFWYYALCEFIKGKHNSKDWEFNYLAMAFLRIAAVLTEEQQLQRKMIHFIYEQNIENAKTVQEHIAKLITKKALDNIFEKIQLLCADIQQKNSGTKKELFIIAGANGTGKSTLAQQIIAQKRSNGESIEFINADEIARDLNPKDIDAVKIQAGKIALKTAAETVQNKKSFIVESTISGRIKETEYSLKTLIKNAKKEKYDIRLLYIYLDSSTLCKERIKVRVAKKGHNVPNKDVDRRYKRSIKNFFAYQNLVNNWTLYSNNTDNFIEIAKSESGIIEILDDKTYNRIKEVAFDEEK